MKDAYYFPHDSNATDDPKIMILISELGIEGYGIYWILIEHLRNQPDFRSHLRVLKALGMRYSSSEEKFKAVVLGYDLFEVVDEHFFYSISLINRLQPLREKQKKLSEAGKKGNLIRWGSGGDRVVIASKVNKSRVDKNKVNKSKEINALPFDSEIFIQTWNNWKQHRKEIKHKLTPTSIKEQFATLANYSEDIAIKMINKSIESGWQGIFELKDNNKDNLKNLKL